MNYLHVVTKILVRYFNRIELFELCLILSISLERSNEETIQNLALKIVNYCDCNSLHEKLIAYVIMQRPFLSTFLAPYLCDCNKNVPNAEYFARELKKFRAKEMSSFIKLLSLQERPENTSNGIVEGNLKTIKKGRVKTKVFMSEFVLPIDFKSSSLEHVFK